MTLQISDSAPDFGAETGEGRVHLYSWIGDSRAVLFTIARQVCATDLGYMAKLKSEFDRRNVKINEFSVDPVDHRSQWLKNIEEDPEFRSKLSNDRRPRPEHFESLELAPGSR
jgi:thioredoxin-dependent peroxiredoxin